MIPPSPHTLAYLLYSSVRKARTFCPTEYFSHPIQSLETSLEPSKKTAREDDYIQMNKLYITPKPYGQTYRYYL